MASSSRRSTFSSNVLCPVDFSIHSGVALQFAAAIAARVHGRLRLLFVNDPLLVAAAGAAAFDSRNLGAATAAELKRFAASTLSARALARVQAEYSTALGQPAREILRAADRHHHDLIVIGTRGLNTARRLMLGSTTSEVLHRASIPVLAVPPADALADQADAAVARGWPGRTVVAALELGPSAAHDVASCASVARSFDARLLLVTIVKRPAAPPWYPADLDAHVRIDCAKAKAALDRLAVHAGDVRLETIVRAGHPPDEIAALAGERKAGLIVITRRWRRHLFAEAPGMFAYHVLCHGVAPVLEIPDKPHTMASTRR